MPITPACRLFSLRTFVILGISSAVLFLLQACGAQQDDAQVRVQLKWLHQGQFVGFYVAEQKGLYREAGLEVELREGGPNIPVIQSVLTGTENCGVAGASEFLVAYSKQAPIMAVAAVYRQTPEVYFSKSELGITSPEDFIGHKVGVKTGQNNFVIYQAMLRNAGVSRENITEVPVGPDMTPFFAGSVDVWPGYRTNEFIRAKRKGLSLNAVKPEDWGVRVLGDIIFCETNFIESSPEIVGKFVTATVAAWKLALEDLDTAVRTTMKYSQNDMQHERAMIEASVDLIRLDGLPIGTMSLQEWQSVRDLLAGTDFIDEERNSFDLNGAFTNDFING